MANHDDNDILPADLVAALKARERSADVITTRVDHTLMALAAEQFAARRRAPRRYAWAAAAAIAAVAIAATVLSRSPSLGRDDLFTDVDGSGRIDIADVLVLARDGRGLTDADLEAFAASVVRLDEG